MASAEVLLPSPRVNMLDSGQLTSVDSVSLPSMCGPHRGVRRPSGTAESESDSPPSKKSKQARRRKKKRQLRQRSGAFGMRVMPVAPLNTTQFLMAEHDQLQDTDIVAARPRRHRDSSLSVDSEDQQAYDEFYSSPEDEEEFLAREFWTAYEDVHAERLDTMTKAQLVQEYLALEEKVDLLERQLRAVRARHRYRQRQDNEEEEEEDEDEEAVRPGEVLVDSETAEKISIFQSEISSLETENRRLREENSKLRRSSRSSSSSSSSSEDSSSSSSSSSSDSSDSEMEAEEQPRARAPLAALPTTTTCSLERVATPDTSALPLVDTPESRLDSGVSCDGAEAAREGDEEDEEQQQPSSFTTPPASPTLEEQKGAEVSRSLKDVTGGVGGGEGEIVEGEVSSTTST